VTDDDVGLRGHDLLGVHVAEGAGDHGRAEIASAREFHHAPEILAPEGLQQSSE
jgi:hypothetical protein